MGMVMDSSKYNKIIIFKCGSLIGRVNGEHSIELLHNNLYFGNATDNVLSRTIKNYLSYYNKYKDIKIVFKLSNIWK